MIVQTGKGFNLNIPLRKLAGARSAAKNDIGRMAVNHFKGNFRAQGFVDNSVDPWKARKEKSKKKTSRGILIQSGNLRRSIQVLGMPGNRVIVGTRGMKYAKRHNEGLKMPKRQFIGNSKQLEGKALKSIQRIFKKIWA